MIEEYHYHVLMQIKDQRCQFDGKMYPHYTHGWKKEDKFHTWNGTVYNEDQLNAWMYMFELPKIFQEKAKML